MWQLQAEIALCVVGADVLDDRAQEFHIGGIFAVFHPVADEFAEYSAEVLMTGVAQEGAGVGQHTDEVAQQAQVGEASHLLDHAGLGVVEPPDSWDCKELDTTEQLN